MKHDPRQIKTTDLPSTIAEIARETYSLCIEILERDDQVPPKNVVKATAQALMSAAGIREMVKLSPRMCQKYRVDEVVRPKDDIQRGP